MSNIQQLADLLGKAVKIARNGGKAVQGTYVNGSVVVNGVIYSAKTIVPFDPKDGQKVYVQIDAGGTIAYIIG